MSSVSSCRTRCGYPEHAAPIRHPGFTYTVRSSTGPYGVRCIARNRHRHYSSSIPTRIAVMGKRRRQVISIFAPTYGPSRPPPYHKSRTFQAGRSTASGLFLPFSVSSPTRIIDHWPLPRSCHRLYLAGGIYTFYFSSGSSVSPGSSGERAAREGVLERESGALSFLRTDHSTIRRAVPR